MTAAVITHIDYPAGSITSRTELINAIKTAMVTAGWEIEVDTREMAGAGFQAAVDLKRVQNASTKGTLYLRLTARPSNFGFLVGNFSSDTADFAAASQESGTGGWINDLSATSFKFISCLHPEAAVVHIRAQEPATNPVYGWFGVIRPIQKPSFINENNYCYGIHLFGTGDGANAQMGVWGANTSQKNPYFNQGLIVDHNGQSTARNTATFNQFEQKREIYPSYMFKTLNGWYGTTSADIVKASYEFPRDILVLPSGVQYAPCVPFSGAAIRI